MGPRSIGLEGTSWVSRSSPLLPQTTPPYKSFPRSQIPLEKSLGFLPPESCSRASWPLMVSAVYNVQPTCTLASLDPSALCQHCSFIRVLSSPWCLTLDGFASSSPAWMQSSFHEVKKAGLLVSCLNRDLHSPGHLHSCSLPLVQYKLIFLERGSWNCTW